MVSRIRWTPGLVNKFWDGIAQTELDSMSFGKVAGPEFLELIRKFVPPGARILDFGAGSGDFLELLFAEGIEAAAFEPSPNRKSVLLARIGQRPGFMGIKDAASTDEFDVVFLMEVIEHVLDEQFDAVLDRAVRFVRPGGCLIASTPHNENLVHASVYCPVSDTFFHPWQHVRSFTHTQLVDCFSKVGLRKEFLALVDFSCDAELIENQKRMSAVDQKRQAAIRKALADIEELTTKAQLLPLELALDEGAASRQQHSNAYVDSATGMLRDVHALLANALASDEGFSQPPTRTDDGVDLRVGKEATIVYIGKK